MSNSTTRCQQGMSLVEVMVAVVILASGLLGLAALQARSLVFAQSSHYRSVAADLAADLADRIRANRSPLLALNDKLPPARPADLPATPDFSGCAQDEDDRDQVIGCPAGFLVAGEMTAWNDTLRDQLVNGRWTLVSVAAGQGFRYTLTITWLDDRTGNADASYTTVIE